MLLEENPDISPKDIAQALGEYATEKNNGKNRDDITIIVINFCSNNEY